MPDVIDVVPPQEEFSGAIVMEDVHGNLLKGGTASLTDAWAFMMGEILAKLHTINVQSYGDLSKEGVKRTGRKAPLEFIF